MERWRRIPSDVYPSASRTSEAVKPFTAFKGTMEPLITHQRRCVRGRLVCPGGRWMFIVHFFEFSLPTGRYRGEQMSPELAGVGLQTGNTCYTALSGLSCPFLKLIHDQVQSDFHQGGELGVVTAEGRRHRSVKVRPWSTGNWRTLSLRVVVVVGGANTCART